MYQNYTLALIEEWTWFCCVFSFWCAEEQREGRVRDVPEASRHDGAERPLLQAPVTEPLGGQPVNSRLIDEWEMTDQLYPTLAFSFVLVSVHLWLFVFEWVCVCVCDEV